MTIAPHVRFATVTADKLREGQQIIYRGVHAWLKTVQPQGDDVFVSYEEFDPETGDDLGLWQERIPKKARVRLVLAA